MNSIEIAPLHLPFSSNAYVIQRMQMAADCN